MKCNSEEFDPPLVEIVKVTRPPVFAGKIWVRLVKNIHTQDRSSGEKFKFLSISKHSSLVHVKLGVVWLNVKSYQTDCPVKNYKLSHRLHWLSGTVHLLTLIMLLFMSNMTSQPAIRHFHSICVQYVALWWKIQHAWICAFFIFSVSNISLVYKSRILLSIRFYF